MQKVDGIAVWDEGLKAGKPIIFIHGFPFDHTMWKPQIEALKQDFRVISYDVRGHGASDVGESPYRLDGFVEDLIAILDALRIAKVTVCGLSMGGYIALRAVERYPNRFESLVLCDTRSTADTEEGKKRRLLTAELVKKSLVPSYAEESVKALFSAKTMAEKKEIVDLVKDMIRGNTVDGIVFTLSALAGRTDTTPALKQMALPALILTGEEDNITPPSDARAMAAVLPNARLYLIPQAAHLSNLENPQYFNEKLTAFLNSIKE